MQTIFKPRLIPALLSLAFSGLASASGFQLSEQSASGIGVANAGAAAVAEDATTTFYNPAGMTYLGQGHSLSMAATVLDRRTTFTDEGTSGTLNTAFPAGFGRPVGSDGGNGGGTHVIPALYYSYALTPEWRLGLAINPTFADETEYDKTFAGRYSGLKTSIKIVNVNPSVAYKVNDQLSIGAGINYAKAQVKFMQAIPTGPITPDAYGTLEGDDTGWGYNLGLMLQLTPQTRVGLSYRSRIMFHLEGTQTATNSAVSNGIKAQLETPDTASLALHHRLNERWAIMSDITWTGWSSVQALSPILASTGAAAVAPLRYNFKDTYRLGMGATYQLNEKLMLRAGTAYDKNPIPDEQSRTMTVPDGDRIWLAFGARWTLSPKATLDMGYAHIFVKDEHTARAVKNTAETVTVQTVRGKFENAADMLSLQLNYAF